MDRQNQILIRKCKKITRYHCIYESYLPFPIVIWKDEFLPDKDARRKANDFYNAICSPGCIFWQMQKFQSIAVTMTVYVHPLQFLKYDKNSFIVLKEENYEIQQDIFDFTLIVSLKVMNSSCDLIWPFKDMINLIINLLETTFTRE